jgi:thiamine pyrophosphate-dependent acetolactate synthase large subunit-like protein
MFTASSVFIRSLTEAGITHAFVNWGSDHPALLEELERLRTEEEDGMLQIVTCPNEMVALSAAQGYAQVTGKPAAVVVHVDVGTQVCFFVILVHVTSRLILGVVLGVGGSYS